MILVIGDWYATNDKSMILLYSILTIDDGEKMPVVIFDRSKCSNFPSSYFQPVIIIIPFLSKSVFWRNLEAGMLFSNGSSGRRSADRKHVICTPTSKTLTTFHPFCECDM